METRVALGTRPASRGSLIQGPRLKSKALLLERRLFRVKLSTFSKFQDILVRKTLCSGPRLALIIPAS